jgi:hypothetical protein
MLKIPESIPVGRTTSMPPGASPDVGLGVLPGLGGDVGVWASPRIGNSSDKAATVGRTNCLVEKSREIPELNME